MENKSNGTGQIPISEPVFVFHKPIQPVTPFVKSKLIPINVLDRGGYIQNQVYADCWIAARKLGVIR